MKQVADFDWFEFFKVRLIHVGADCNLQGCRFQFLHCNIMCLLVQHTLLGSDSLLLPTLRVQVGLKEVHDLPCCDLLLERFLKALTSEHAYDEIGEAEVLSHEQL